MATYVYQCPDCDYAVTSDIRHQAKAPFYCERHPAKRLALQPPKFDGRLLGNMGSNVLRKPQKDS